MMDWTDRHCRFFLRQVSAGARLYTEMITTGALIHGDVPRHLGFSEEEHPVALQLGGSEPEDLAQEEPAVPVRPVHHWCYAETMRHLRAGT